MHTFKFTTNGYRKGSALRQKGVGETKNGVGLHRGDVDKHDAMRMASEAMSSWEGIRSSHGDDILGLAGQQ